jgi:hypothetical protein
LRSANEKIEQLGTELSRTQSALVEIIINIISVPDCVLGKRAEESSGDEHREDLSREAIE